MIDLLPSATALRLSLWSGVCHATGITVTTKIVIGYVTVIPDAKLLATFLAISMVAIFETVKH